MNFGGALMQLGAYTKWRGFSQCIKFRCSNVPKQLWSESRVWLWRRTICHYFLPSHLWRESRVWQWRRTICHYSLPSHLWREPCLEVKANYMPLFLAFSSVKRAVSGSEGKLYATIPCLLICEESRVWQWRRTICHSSLPSQLQEPSSIILFIISLIYNFNLWIKWESFQSR